MNATEPVCRLHQHRMWVNQRLLAAVRLLPHSQRHRTLPIGQGSVWRTLTHLLAAEYVWLEALLGNEEPLLPGDAPDQLPGNQAGDGAISSLDALALKWRELDQRWEEYLSGLRPDALNDTVYKVSTSSNLGKRLGAKRRDILLHVCTHAQYTAAQLVNMLRQLGQADPPDVMLISFARQEADAKNGSE